MPATVIRLADHRTSPLTLAHQAAEAAEAMRDLMTALAAQDRAAARVTAAEGRGAPPPEVAFLRRLWRTARAAAALAEARHGRAALRVA